MKKKVLFVPLALFVILFSACASGKKGANLSATNSTSNSDVSVGISSNDQFDVESLEYRTDDENAPVVYFTREITPESLVKVYKAMGWTPHGKVGVKLSTGEPPSSNYLRPTLIGKLVHDELGATIVECNTAYGGSRASNAMHKQVVKDHGFLDIASFDLLDEDGVMEIPVSGGTRLKNAIVGSHFKDYDSYLVLNHFKGHAMAGFGGAIKNLSIGFGSGSSSRESGKVLIHSGGTRTSGSIFGDQVPFLESMAEAAKAACDYMGNENGIAFVSVMNRISIDCDCDGHPHEPELKDIGILASTDPLAIDQAGIDMIYAYKNSAGDSAQSLINRIEDRQGRHTLEHAQEIGLGKGSRNYRLVEVQ